MKPDSDTADTLEAALRTMCFHQRAGKLQQTLEKLGVAKASKALRNGNHLSEHQQRLEAERRRNIGARKRRRLGGLVLSWEAEEAASLQVPNDIPRSFRPYVPVSAREQREADKMDILKSDLLAASYEFQTTGFDRGFRRWVDPKFDTGFPLDKSVAGFGFVCGFPGCGHCSTTKLGTHHHYLNKHRDPILKDRSRLKTSSSVCLGIFQ